MYYTQCFSHNKNNENEIDVKKRKKRPLKAIALDIYLNKFYIKCFNFCQQSKNLFY